MLNEQQAQPEPMMTKLLDTKMKPLATKLLKHLLWSYNETLTVPLNSHKTGKKFPQNQCLSFTQN